MSYKKAAPRQGFEEVVVLLSAGDFLTAINKIRALNIGSISVVLVILLNAKVLVTMMHCSKIKS